MLIIYTASDIPETNTIFEWKKESEKTVLIVKKQRDPHCVKWLNTIAGWLTQSFNARVLVEPEAVADSPFVQTYHFLLQQQDLSI